MQRTLFFTRITRYLDLGSLEAHTRQQRRLIQIGRVNLVFDVSVHVALDAIIFPGRIPLNCKRVARV